MSKEMDENQGMNWKCLYFHWETYNKYKSYCYILFYIC